MKLHDKQGKQISLLKWAEYVDKEGYKVVEQTKLPNGLWVSTIWLGIDQGFNISGIKDYKPTIFETMVFRGEERLADTYFCKRYLTLKEAQIGHKQIVAHFTNPKYEVNLAMNSIQDDIDPNMLPW